MECIIRGKLGELVRGLVHRFAFCSGFFLTLHFFVLPDFP